MPVGSPALHFQRSSEGIAHADRGLSCTLGAPDDSLSSQRGRERPSVVCTERDGAYQHLEDRGRRIRSSRSATAGA